MYLEPQVTPNTSRPTTSPRRSNSATAPDWFSPPVLKNSYRYTLTFADFTADVTNVTLTFQLPHYHVIFKKLSVNFMVVCVTAAAASWCLCLETILPFQTKIEILPSLKKNILTMFSRALFSPDPGRHLPCVSAAGALQLSGLSV